MTKPACAPAVPEQFGGDLISFGCPMRLVRCALFASVAGVAIASAGAAAAQATPNTQTDSAAAATQPLGDRAKRDATTQVQEVVVTGSRIARPNLEQPTPVSIISPQAIQNAGTPNLGDIIARLPAVGFSGTVRANSNNFGTGAGLAQINLRDLGTSRTLVLVDGQRHVAGDIFSNAVDINSIPTALVDHVEVVTGGASAIYGSDAVTGVVNIILKKDFEGLEAQAQGGEYGSGYGGTYSGYITAGHTFLNGKLNITATGYYSQQNGIEAYDIPKVKNYGTIVNQNDIPSGSFDPTYYTSGAPITKDGIPDRLQVPNVGSDYLSRNGVLIAGDFSHPLIFFDARGNPIPVAPRTGYNSFAFGQLPANCGTACYFTDDFNEIRSPLTTNGGDFTAHYEATPHLRFSLDAKYADSQADNLIQPSYTFGDFQLQPDNAFITPALRAQLAGLAPADYPYIGKFLNGGRDQKIDRGTYRIVAGAAGDFDLKFADINWNGALNYGETDTTIKNEGLRFSPAKSLTNGNFGAAFDSVIDPATGQPACRINVPSAQPAGYAAPTGVTNAASCVPFSPFGLNNSQAAYAYSFGSFDQHDKLTQQVANLNASFDTGRFLNLQGGAVAFAIGYEYRMERTQEVNDARLIAGDTENLATNSAGGFNVNEGYVEVNVPVFKHWRPGFDELNFDAAYRGSQYSTVGHTDAYKYSFVYGPVSDLKLRGTYSVAVRAPNITEAFSPISSGFFNITDPCDISNITGSTNYAKNCAAQGVPANFTSSTNSSIIGSTGGNPNLHAEASTSYTAGIVVQPHWIPRLNFTFDYYSIKIKNAIVQVAAQDVINNCYNGASLEPTFCSQFTRNPTTHNIDFVSTTYLNASKLQTEGLDFQANYNIGVEGLTQRFAYTRFLDGKLSVDANVNYVFRLHNFPFQNDPSQVNVIEGSIRSFSAQNIVDATHLKGTVNLTYQQGPLQVAWQTRYLGRAANFNRDVTTVDKSEGTNQPFAKPAFFHDLILRYDLGGSAKGTQIFGGINDIFGDTPPAYLIGTGSDVGYDLGRYIFAGVKYRR